LIQKRNAFWKYLGGRVVCGGLGGINGGDGIIPGRWTRRGDTVGEHVFREDKAKVNDNILGLRANITSKSLIYSTETDPHHQSK
jgi:hypothetical protein